jgi:hypothetical protein
VKAFGVGQVLLNMFHVEAQNISTPNMQEFEEGKKKKNYGNQ